MLASKIKNAGVSEEIAIASAVKELKLKPVATDNGGGGNIGALPTSGNGDTEISKNVSAKEWLNKPFEEQEKYRAKHGEPKFKL